MLDLTQLPEHRVLPEPQHECLACKDTGFEKLEIDGQLRARKCGCRSPGSNPHLVREQMARCGMEAEEIEIAYSAWDEGHQAKPLFARKWLLGILEGKIQAAASNPWCLGLIGAPGRGKTKTAAVLVRLFIESGGSFPLWIRVPEGFDRVQRERFELGVEETLEDKITKAGLVVFDDFGIAHRSKPELVEATVCEWLARRHRRHGPSIITTNASTIASIGAPRIESRLSEGVYKLMEARSDYRDSH